MSENQKQYDLEERTFEFAKRVRVFIKKLPSGLDFLGWVHFPHHRVLRTSTKRRMFKRLRQKSTKETIASYLGMLKHGNTHKVILMIKTDIK